MMLVNGNVIIAKLIEPLARKIVAQYCWVALYEGVQPLFAYKIACYGLYLIRRAAVQRGYGHAGCYARRYGGKVFAHIGKAAVQLRHAFGPYGGGGSVLHALYKSVYLFGLNARKVVAHAHVELKAFGVAKVVKLCNKLYCKVCLNVFLKRLRHGKLRAPFAVVAFVVCQYAGAADAGGKLLAVHLLHGFQFKEPRAGVVARNYVFSKLRIGACGGAEGGLQLFAEEHKRARVLLNIGRAYAENRPACFLFAKHPFYKRLKGQWVHSFAHFMFLPL